MRFVSYICSVGILALTLGCGMIRHGPETCILGVIVNGGQRAASGEEIAALEQRIAPILAERGLKISHNKEDADLLARVELNATDPTHWRYSIRAIEPNPFLPSVRPQANDALAKVNADLRTDMRRDEAEFSISK
jgi:hypothetical protein